MNQNPILKKIKKMLELANRAGTKEEGETALLKAQELMLKHSVDNDDINSLNENEIIELPYDTSKKRTANHIKFIAVNLLEHFPVEVFHGSNHFYSTVFIIGKKLDAQYFKIFLEATIKYFDRTLKISSKYIPKKHKKHYKHSFLGGFCTGLIMALSENEIEKSLIIVTPNAVVKHLKKIATGKKSHVKASLGGTGFNTGSEEGYSYGENRKKKRIEHNEN